MVLELPCFVSSSFILPEERLTLYGIRRRHRVLPPSSSSLGLSLDVEDLQQDQNPV
jgi:hypothetical protein